MKATGQRSAPARRARWRRRGRRLAWTAMVLTLCFLFGRFLLLTWVIAPAAGIALGSPVDIAQASCAPTARLDLSNLRIGELDDPFLTTGKVEARYRLWRTLFFGPCVEKFHAQGVTINLANLPKGRIRLPRFRWLRRRRRDDNEDIEPFLLKDLVLGDSTVVYQRAGSPLALRLENVRANLPELRHGQSGRLTASGRIAQLDIGPLHLSSGQLHGHSDLSYDREMELLHNSFSFHADHVSGTLGTTPLDNLTLRLSGTTRQVRGRGHRQDLQLALTRDGAPMATITIEGYSSKVPHIFDLTARVTAEPELINLALAEHGSPPADQPRLAIAARLCFPRPRVAEVSAAITAQLAGKTVAVLDMVTEYPFASTGLPAHLRLTGERLAIDQLLAIYTQVQEAKSAETTPKEPAPAATQPESPDPGGLRLPSFTLDLDLRGVSYGELAGTLSADADLRDRRLELSQCTATLADGTAQLTGVLGWGQSSHPYQGKLTVAKLDAGLVARQFMDAADGEVLGHIDQLDLDLAGQGLSIRAMQENMTGKGTAMLSGIALRDMKAMRRTVRKYGVKGLADLRFDQGILAGRIADGRVRLDKGSLHGPTGWVELTGSMRFRKQKLELMVDAGLGPELADDLRNSRKYRYLGLLLKSRDGYACFPTPIPLRGSLSRPRLDVERLLLGAATSPSIQDAALPFLKHALQK
ncbi:MAG: hypothetical protein HN380_19535 [Victivallales bacterium]|nr:hypothetical protein [Victivallales bacterium]